MAEFSKDAIIPAPGTSSREPLRAERVWKHRYDIDLADFQPRRSRRRLLIATSVLGLAVFGTVSLYHAGPVPRDVAELHSTPAALPVAPVLPTAVPEKVVDNSPSTHTAMVSEFPQIEVAPVPQPRPVGKLPATPIIADAKVKTEKSPQAVRFDQCTPACDTRDPLIVGAQAPFSEPMAVSAHLPAAALPEEQRPTRLALVGAVLYDTAILPVTTLNVGRMTLGKMTGMQ